MSSSNTISISVNNGYKLNTLAKFDNTVKEVRLMPDDVKLTSNIPYLCNTVDNKTTGYYFRWEDLNSVINESNILSITTKVFDKQTLCYSAQNNVIDGVGDINLIAHIMDTDYNASRIVDMNNKFCKAYSLILDSSSKVSIDTYSQQITNVIVKIYDALFNIIYDNNSVLPIGNYGILISNGDDIISGGSVNLHVNIEPVVSEPFYSAVATTINPDSTHNFSGSIALTNQTLDDALCSVYKITIDRYCNIKSINSSFSGTSQSFGVYLFGDGANSKILTLEYSNSLFDTIIAPGTYYILFSVGDTDKNKCVGNFSFDIVTSGNIQQGSDTLSINSVNSTLYVYNNQLLTNTLVKADPTATAKLYPNNIDYTATSRLTCGSGEYKCFAVITSADGLTKKITNVVTVITANVIADSATIEISPASNISNGTEVTISSNFYVYNVENYMIPGTNKVIVTIKNNTKNTQLGIVDLSVDSPIFTIANSVAGDEIQFDAVFFKFEGDPSGATYTITTTLV